MTAFPEGAVIAWAVRYDDDPTLIGVHGVYDNWTIALSGTIAHWGQTGHVYIRHEATRREAEAETLRLTNVNELLGGRLAIKPRLLLAPEVATILNGRDDAPANHAAATVAVRRLLGRCLAFGEPI